MFLQFGFGPLWLALMNGGGVRASIQAPAGTAYPYSITQNDVLTVLPVRGQRQNHCIEDARCFGSVMHLVVLVHRLAAQILSVD